MRDWIKVGFVWLVTIAFLAMLAVGLLGGCSAPRTDVLVPPDAPLLLSEDADLRDPYAIVGEPGHRHWQQVHGVVRRGKGDKVTPASAADLAATRPAQ